MKRIIILFLLLLSFNSFSTKWQYGGGLDGEAGLMIVYKSIPPLVLKIDEPETILIPSGNGTFKYSEISKSKKPLNVRLEVKFNSHIVENNSVNKSIISTIYDTARYSFINNGSFFLEKTSIKNGEILIEEGIDGEVFFTDINGNEEAANKAKIINRKLSESVKDGILNREDVYIDAIFNRRNKQLTTGRYEGKTTLVVEFLGRGALN